MDIAGHDGQSGIDGKPPAVRYAHALEVGDDVAAEETVAEVLESGVDPIAIVNDILTPAMRRIGGLWERGEMTIAEEHLASAIAARSLATVYPSLFWAPPLSRQRVVIAAVEGEQHVLGAQMAAYVLEGHGFDVAFLGADVPRPRLLEAIERYRPHAVGLGCTTTDSRGTLLATLSDLQRFPELEVLLGGIGVPADVEAVTPRVGPRCTRVSDASEALTVLERALAA